MELTNSAFIQASERISKYIPPSTLKYSPWLSNEIDGQVFLKLECFNPSNSFKIRGATNYLMSFIQYHGHKPSHVVTASGGNHGISIAVACSWLQIPCTIFLPSNSVTPNRLLVLEKYYGAEVLVRGSVWNEAHNEALEYVKQCGPDCLYAHPFDHPWVWMGQGTISRELMVQMKDNLPDYIIASVGGGGLMVGLTQAFKHEVESGNSECSKVKFVSVETFGADWFALSMKSNKRETVSNITSIAKPLGAGTASDQMWEMLRDSVEFATQVTDKQALEAIDEILSHERILVEPACSCVVAALLNHKETFKGKRVVLTICGANCTPEEVEQWKASTFAQ